LKISCIIPTRNRCSMVLEAIESIRRQDHSHLEIIVVDDGSTDNTQAEIKSRVPEIRQVRLNGAGPGPARNAGVAASSGDILMFLDSDDLWLENHVRQLQDTLNLGYQVAYGVTKTIDEIRGSDFLIPDKGERIEGDCFDALTRWCFLVPSSVAISRKAFMAVGGFDNVACGEDWTFFLKLSARFPFGYAGPLPITLRRLRRGSLCFLSDKKKLLVIINQVFTVLENEPRATAAHRNHFTMLHEWTAANMDQWSTVQDWYLEMLKENII
jgi:glycosyltransferase involved in cell wall biosynthesis